MAKQVINNSESGAVVRSKLNSNYTELYTRVFVTPEDYGAVGDGATNDFSAIQAAIDSGYPVFFSAKNYRITTGLTVPVNGVLWGSGKNSIISITTAINILTLSGHAIIDSLHLKGSDITNQRGIRVSDTGYPNSTKVLNKISNCTFSDLNYGINAIDVLGAGYEGAFGVVNCTFSSCVFGVYLEAQAEYNDFVNCAFISNTTAGIRLDGGNNTVVGGHMTGNVNAVYVTNGGNSGKNIFSGIKMNHNTTALGGTGIGLGINFSNCNIFGGNINVQGNDIRFVNCVFSDGAPTTWNMTNCLRLEFVGCKFVYNPTITLTSSTYRFFNNYFQTGIIPSYATKGLNVASLTAGITSGVATLVDGTVTVSLTSVTTNSQILVTTQTPGGTIGFVYISSRIASTSFTITSSNILDTSVVAWFVLEP